MYSIDQNRWIKLKPFHRVSNSVYNHKQRPKAVLLINNIFYIISDNFKILKFDPIINKWQRKK